MAEQTTNRRINLYINGREVRNNIKSIAAEYKKSKNQLNKLTRGTEEYNRKAAEVRRLKGILDEHNQKLRQTRTRWQRLKDTAKGFLPMLGVGTAVMGAQRLANFAQQLEKTRHQVRQLTGVSDEEGLQGLTSSIKAVSETFNVDFNKVLEANNALAENMNITHQEAIETIKEGYLAGADASGEFLDMLREYPAQLREVGLTADQAVAFMTQTVQKGIFSDKGIDAIKEANLRIREMTDSTREAIDNIGLSSEGIQEQLMTGEKSMFEVIQMISEQLDKLPPQSQKVGEAIADIFGGPGEDAGVEFLSTIGDINTEMEGLVDNTDSLTQSQSLQIQATEELNDSYQKLLGKQSGLNKFWQQTKLVVGSTVNDIMTVLQSEASLGQKLAAVINPAQRALIATQARANEAIDEHQAKQEKLRETLVKQAKSYGIVAEKLDGLTNDEIKELIKQRKEEIRANEMAKQSAEEKIKYEEWHAEKMINLVKGIKEASDEAQQGMQELDEEGIKRVQEATEELQRTFEFSPAYLDEKDIFGMTDEDWQELQNKFSNIRAAAWELGATLSNVAEIQRNQNTKELDEYKQVQEQKKQALERRLEAGIISQKEYDQRVAQMDKNLQDQKEQMAKEEAKRQKQINTFQAIIDTAAAVVRYLANPGGWAGIALSGMAAATGATQIAAIQSKPVPQFEEGGRVKKNQVVEVAEGDKEEGILSNKTLTDPETGPMANYLLDKQAGTASAAPDADAIAKAMDYNNFKRAGGSFGGGTQNVNNNYNYYTGTDEGMKAKMDEMIGAMKNMKHMRAVISNDVKQEHEEEQELLNRLNEM